MPIPSSARVRESVSIETTELHIPRLGRTAWLSTPEQPRHTVLFVNGAGAGPEELRHHSIARGLNARGVATFLLGGRPAGIDAHDIELLTDALIQSARFIADEPALGHLPLGIVGVGTGAAAALIASLALGTRIGAVVSCSGRPDIAHAILRLVAVPTLLIVGAADSALLELNRCAFALLGCDKGLALLPHGDAEGEGESEAGLEAAAEHAALWLDGHLRGTG